MPARVLVLADRKVLPALADGLREQGGFEVSQAATVGEAAAQLGEPLQAAVIFYGGPDWSLRAALQALQPARQKGALVCAVLQRQQAAARDDCFLAGASEVLFMPLAKDAFAARLREAIALADGAGPAAVTSVQVASRTKPVTLPDARVTADGVQGSADLPFERSQTVRVSWKSEPDSFFTWALVTSASPARVRFAGLTPDEQTRIRAWIEAHGGAPAAVTAESAATSAPATPDPAAPVPAAAALPDDGSDIEGSEVSAAPDDPSREEAAAAFDAPVPPAPQAPPAPTPPDGSTPVQVARAPPAGIHELFEDMSPPARSEPAQPMDLGVPWPEPWPTAWCRDAVFAILRNTPVAKGPPGDEQVAKKVLLKATPSERALADRVGEPSPTPAADALTARVALAGAQAAGEALIARGGAVLVDAVAAAALTSLADAAGARLQDAANKAIAKGDTETLRVLTSARSALSHEVLGFRKMADKLRGLSAAPALGPGGLDPDVAVAGSHKARPRAAPAPVEQPLQKISFSELQSSPRSRRIVLALGIGALLLISGLAYALHFGRVRAREAKPAQMEKAGQGVVRIATTGKAALVIVTPAWAERAAENARPLTATLAAMGVERAVLQLPDGRPLGGIDVRKGNVFLSAPKAAPPRQ